MRWWWLVYIVHIITWGRFQEEKRKEMTELVVCDKNTFLQWTEEEKNPSPFMLEHPSLFYIHIVHHSSALSFRFAFNNNVRWKEEKNEENLRTTAIWLLLFGWKFPPCSALSDDTLLYCLPQMALYWKTYFTFWWNLNGGTLYQSLTGRTDHTLKHWHTGKKAFLLWAFMTVNKHANKNISFRQHTCQYILLALAK